MLFAKTLNLLSFSHLFKSTSLLLHAKSLFLLDCGKLFFQWRRLKYAGGKSRRHCWMSRLQYLRASFLPIPAWFHTSIVETPLNRQIPSKSRTASHDFKPTLLPNSFAVPHDSLPPPYCHIVPRSENTSYHHRYIPTFSPSHSSSILHGFLLTVLYLPGST